MDTKRTSKAEREAKLDEAVEQSFPASDPIALGQGVTPPIADYSRRPRRPRS